MEDSKLKWLKHYIKLNQDRKDKKMVLNENGEERNDSVVIDCTPYSIKVAINCGSYVSIKELCLLEGNKDYHIESNYFNMSKFNN